MYLMPQVRTSLFYYVIRRNEEILRLKRQFQSRENCMALEQKKDEGGGIGGRREEVLLAAHHSYSLAVFVFSF